MQFKPPKVKPLVNRNIDFNKEAGKVMKKIQMKGRKEGVGVSSA